MKADHQSIGFQYTVTEEQVRAHQKLTIEEIFQWLESMNELLYAVQTPEERQRMFFLKGKNLYTTP